MSQVLNHLLKKIPHQPGVYRMKNAQGEIIYIGKAKDLSKRVNSYFKNTVNQVIRTVKMVENIADIEYTVTSSEIEALILETNLIKENRPKYNILMKDDKNFAYIKITVNEDYPRILITRKVLPDGAKYFGPKTSAGKIYDTLTVLRKIFPYRNCNLDISDLGPAPQGDPNRKRLVKVTRAGIKYPCLDLHIKRCVAPCIGRPSREEYQNIITQISNFLEGKFQPIVEQLKTQMFQAAKDKKFEQAGKIRDKILSIENLYQEKQLVSSPDQQNADIINYYLEDDQAYFNLFQIRAGKLIDQQNVAFKRPVAAPTDDAGKQEMLATFLQQYYLENSFYPQQIVLPDQLEEVAIYEDWLSQKAGQKIKIIVPQKGKNDKLLELSLENAISFAKQSHARWEGESKQTRDAALEKLAQIIGLKEIPKRLECYDISHLAGTHTVASMAVFENGFPKKEHYRHFKISLDKPGRPDDFANMEEVILRRLKYLKPSLITKGITVLKEKIKKAKTIEKIKNKSKNKVSKKTVILPITEPEIYSVKLNKEKLLSFKLHPQSNKLRTFLLDFAKPKQKLAAVMTKIIDKFDCRRLYLVSLKKDIRDYETLGFQKVQTPLEELPVSSQQIVLVYDKTRNYEDPSFKKIPDLIVIDGGKGQLSHAVKAMQDHHLIIPIISLAKKEEELYLPDRTDPIRLANNDQTRLMIQHLRDEAHRFAIEYNRKLRKNDYTSSQLEEIPGIGKLLTQKLLKQFGSLENLKNRSEEEIAAIVGHKNAIKIKSTLN